MKKIITILLTCICISNLSTLAIEGKTDIKNLSNEELLSLYVKENNIWNKYSKAYKKINGNWIEQSELNNVFDENLIYIKGD